MNIEKSESGSAARRFRVLALDGGGIKGTYTAAVLSSLEEMTGKRICDYFDLITGTSTGGIIAVALGLEIPAQQILQLYLERGAEIFPVSEPGWRGRVKGGWKHLWAPKHSQSVLKAAVDSVVGQKQFGESKSRLVIPAFDAVRGRIQLFKTAHSAEYKQDYLRSAATVALGTSAAPTYYPAYSDASGGCYLDGGVWANSPVMVGLLEATCILGHVIDHVDLLSIGTTCSPFDISRGRRSGGVASWNVGLVELLMEAQADAALGQARLLTKNRMLRVDSVARAGRFSLDNSQEIDDLRSLGQQSAREHEGAISRQFLTTQVDAFQPFYAVRGTAPELPDTTDGAAA